MAKYIHRNFNNETFIDLVLHQYGYEECEPFHSFGPAVRNHFLFHYVLSGKGRLLSTDDKGKSNEYHLESGQGFMIWPSQNNMYLADGKSPWVYGWVEFDGMKARELVTLAGFSFNYPVYISKDNNEREKMKTELFNIVNNKDAMSTSLIGHLYLFLSALIASSSSQKKPIGGSLQEFYAREALNFIEQQYHREIGVDDVASYCNLDRSYLGKIFKSILNTTPQEFLIRYRINKACELMKITNYTISEISNMVGYPNPFTFSRVFKNNLEVSPKTWRNKNKI